MLDFELRTTRSLGQSLHAVLALKAQHWPYAVESQMRWFERHVRPSDQHLLGWAGGDLLAYLRVVRAAGRQDGAKCRAVGLLDTVIVDRAHRRKGLGRALMTAVNRMIADEQAIGLLGCDPDLVSFYSHCDWRVFSHPVHFDSDELAKLLPAGVARLAFDPAQGLSPAPLHLSRQAG
jgi:predicted GNAT family N-acyltransferase